MDIIKNYLENMFQSFSNTPEVRRVKEDLLTRMEHKYYELRSQGKTENEAIGAVISEFGDMDQLSKELGLETRQIKDTTRQKGRMLSLQEITDYQNTNRNVSMMIGIGVILCIFSVIPLLLLDTLPIAGQLPGAVGCIFLFVMVAIAVSLFILSGMTSKKYEYLKKELFHLDSSVESGLRSEKEFYQHTFTIQIIVGVCLCILSVIPVILIGSLPRVNDFFENYSIVLLLVFVGIAVYLFIIAGMKMDCYHVLLQEEEYNKDSKKNNLTSLVASVYWPIVTCIYLGYSFISGDWHISWIVWPIAGTLFGAIACICNAIQQFQGKQVR